MPETVRRAPDGPATAARPPGPGSRTPKCWAETRGEGQCQHPRRILPKPNRNPDPANSFLSVTDERTATNYRIPIQDGAIHATDLHQIRTGSDDYGLLSYDPSFANTASCRSAITFIDGDLGDPALSRLSDRRARRVQDVPRGRLPPHPREPAEQEPARGVAPQHHLPHHAPRKRPEVHGRVPPRRPPDGNDGQHPRGPLDLLSGCEEHLRRTHPLPAGLSSDREGSHGGSLRPPALGGHAVHPPEQRPLLQREFSGDDVPSVVDDPVHPGPGARKGPRYAVRAARGPRAELQQQRDAGRRELPRGPVQLCGGGRGRALRPPPRWGQRTGRPNAAGDRQPRITSPS